MRTLEAFSLDLTLLDQELDEYARFLGDTKSPKERAHILPFFAARKHLSAALGYFNRSIEVPDRLASELDLFGDFVCDMAIGDSKGGSYRRPVCLLVEFESAAEDAIFRLRARGKTMRTWSRKFEHGFSQLVDWAWRLSTEGSSEAYARIFSARNATIHLLLIAGRDAGLTTDDLARLEWRSENLSLGQFRMSCVTFDEILTSLRRRLSLASQP